MSEQPDSFWNELKNRKVVRVAILYAVVAWLVLQVADTVTGILELPAWAAQFILVVVTLGFPVALVLAWAFEVTPDGVRRAASVAPEGAHTSRAPFVGGLAVGIASVAAVAYLLSGDSDLVEVADLDEGLVAIVPFEFSGPEELSYLGEGVTHLIAPRFDGEVGPRALDPASSNAIWQDLSTQDFRTPVSRAGAET